MAKRRQKKFDIFHFEASKVFPANNRLAVDILRLMAAYNDMGSVADALGGQMSVATRRIATKKAKVRMGIQYRLLFAFLHEAFRVLDQMQGGDEFKALKPKISDQGLKALKNLQLATGSDNLIRNRLSDARDTAIFHYNADDFQKALGLFANIFLERGKAESQIIIEDTRRAYYILPEHLRDIIVYNFDSSPSLEMVERKVGNLLKEAIKLQRNLYIIIEELFNAYLDDNKLDSELRHEIVRE